MEFLGLDLPTWWFLVIGGLFSGYAILDGFDMGAGTLHLFFKRDKSRRIALNAIGPLWDGNEVWLVIGGGALFAGFPVVYGSLFSAFYIPFMLFLVMIIFRAISIEFRSKEDYQWWRNLWDVSYSVSSTLMALLLGVALGNVIKGMEIGEGFVYQGTFLDMLNPYSLIVGVTTVALFSMHGAIYLTMKTEDRMYRKLTRMVKGTTIFFVLMFIITTLYTLLYVPHMTARFKEYPLLFGVPILVVLAIANITRLVAKRKYMWAFVFSGISIALQLVLVAIGLFPKFVHSTLDPAYSIDIYNAASSDKSLKIMLTFVAIGFPLVAAYTIFVFWTFRGKVKLDESSY